MYDYNKILTENPVPAKLKKQILTFMCDQGQYPINDLKQFTINTGAIVIIRKTARIENGNIIYFN